MHLSSVTARPLSRPEASPSVRAARLVANATCRAFFFASSQVLGEPIDENGAADCASCACGFEAYGEFGETAMATSRTAVVPPSIAMKTRGIARENFRSGLSDSWKTM